MNFVFISSLVLLFLLENAICSKFIPSIAFQPGLPIMYLTNRGWVVSPKIILPKANSSQIIKSCQIMYPDYNITNAVPIFKEEIITNWCNENETCSKCNRYNVRPFHCIDSNYETGSIYSPSVCHYKNMRHRTCISFNSSKSKAENHCKTRNETLFDFKIVYFKSYCENQPMLFNQNEFVCCPREDIPYSKINLDNYMNNTVSLEHQFYSKLKHTLLKNYTIDLQKWAENVKEITNTIFSSNMHLDIKKQKLDELKQNSKIKFFNISEKFMEAFLKSSKIHIKRILIKADSHCVYCLDIKREVIKCVNHLNTVISRFENQYNHILQKKIVDTIGYREYLIKQLENLRKNHTTLFDKFINLTANLNHTLSYLKSKPIDQSYEGLFQREFLKCRENASKDQYIKKKVHGLHLIYIIVTTFILLFLIALTFLATLITKRCNHPLRRSSPNYVMSVVFNTNHTSGSASRSNQQLPHFSNKQAVKLNLYENPIFNAKSLSKPIEKQSLIENMDN